MGVAVHNSLPATAIKHGLHIFPGMGQILVAVAVSSGSQLQVPSPRVEVGRVRVVVRRLGRAVKVENELVGRKEHAAVGTLDAFRPGAVVTRGDEIATATPATFVRHVEGEVLGQLRGTGLLQEGLDQPLGLSLSDHSTSTGGYRHGSGSAENLQLYGGTLDTGDTQGHTTVVDLVVAVRLEESVGDLGQTQPLFGVDHQTHYGDPVQHDVTDRVVPLGVGQDLRAG